MLCRTNIGAVTEVMRLLSDGHRVALTRGGHTLAALALAARDLKDGRRTAHPELVLFASWGELQEYAEHDPAGRDLRPVVDLVDTHGPDAILAAINQLTDEKNADVTVSTAHTAKGREWPTVKIADGFPPPKDTDQHDARGRPILEPVNDTDARLAYVAVTRGRHHLTSAACHGSTPTLPHLPPPEHYTGHADLVGDSFPARTASRCCGLPTNEERTGWAYDRHMCCAETRVSNIRSQRIHLSGRELP